MKIQFVWTECRWWNWGYRFRYCWGHLTLLSYNYRMCLPNTWRYGFALFEVRIWKLTPEWEAVHARLAAGRAEYTKREQETTRA